MTSPELTLVEWTPGSFIALPKVCTKSSAKLAIRSLDFRISKSVTVETIFLEKCDQLAKFLLIFELPIRTIGQHNHCKVITTSNSLRLRGLSFTVSFKILSFKITRNQNKKL